MKTSVLIPTAPCSLLSEKRNSPISAILINWENTALCLWRSGQPLCSGHCYEESQGMDDEWENRISETSSGAPEMFHRWILGKDIPSRNTLARCSACEKQQNSKKAGEAPTFPNRDPKAPGETHCVSASVLSPAPWPPAPPLTRVGARAGAALCRIPDFIRINHFPMDQHKNMLPGPNTAINVLRAKQHVAVSEARLLTTFWVQPLTFL